MTAPGVTTQTCTGLPFGDGLNCTGADSSPQHFTGLERDAETGLDQTWFRKYSSAQGRWLMPDPLGASMDSSSPQSFDRYNYVQGSPTMAVDPIGLLDTLGFCSPEYPGCADAGSFVGSVFGNPLEREPNPWIPCIKGEKDCKCDADGTHCHISGHEPAGGIPPGPPDPAFYNCFWYGLCGNVWHSVFGNDPGRGGGGHAVGGTQACTTALTGVVKCQTVIPSPIPQILKQLANNVAEGICVLSGMAKSYSNPENAAKSAAIVGLSFFGGPETALNAAAYDFLYEAVKADAECQVSGYVRSKE